MNNDIHIFSTIIAKALGLPLKGVDGTITLLD